MNYNIADDKQKYNMLHQLYTIEQKSWADIAKILNSYPNKIRRQAIKLGIKSRTKNEAQSLVLSQCKVKHPTEGKKRPEDTKIKISESMSTVWDNLTLEEREGRADIARENWEKMSKLERENFQNASHKAIRKSSVEGSKLEKFLHKELVLAGYYVEYHKKHFIANENLHLDLFLPIINVAIEVDGPSHFEPVWGEKALRANQKADQEKTGLILSKNLVLIRIKCTKNLSNKYKRDILTLLKSTLDNIKSKYPSRKDRLIILGE